jgi:hypothetical protein
MSKDSGSRSPPVSGRFKKGQSGNPKGRPKVEKRRVLAFDIVIDKTLTVTQGGQSREMTVDEALQHQTLQQAIAGDRAAQRAVLKMIAKREKARVARESGTRLRVESRIEPVDPENADVALLLLGIACRNSSRQDLARDREQLLLEPWAVQAALSRRRGGARLNEDQVREIKRCTHQPDLVSWPRGTDE